MYVFGSLHARFRASNSGFVFATANVMEGLSEVTTIYQHREQNLVLVPHAYDKALVVP